MFPVILVNGYATVTDSGDDAGTNFKLRRSTLKERFTMRDEKFDVAVTIETQRIGRFLTVTRTAHAAALLMHEWPDEKRGPKYRSALKAMMDALEQRRPVGIARRAFTAAAREAEVFVREGPGLITFD
jgi:hypothetical protein